MKNWKISKTVSHDLSPAKWAELFAKKRAKKLGLKWNCAVKVTGGDNSFRGYRGHAFTRKPGTGQILVRLNQSLPPHEHRYPKYTHMPTFVINGSSESIVYIFAHEFGHVLGWPGNKSGEIACCKFGYAAVQAWRDRQYETPAALI